MAERDKAALKEEGKQLAPLLMDAKKKPYNIALMIAKQSVELEAHRRKPTTVLRRQPKRNGAGPKGALGIMTVEGKLITVQSEADDPRSRNVVPFALESYTSCSLDLVIR